MNEHLVLGIISGVHQQLRKVRVDRGTLRMVECLCITLRRLGATRESARALTKAGGAKVAVEIVKVFARPAIRPVDEAELASTAPEMYSEARLAYQAWALLTHLAAYGGVYAWTCSHPFLSVLRHDQSE
jgi:hypothetical protein